MLLINRLPAESWTMTEVRDQMDPAQFAAIEPSGHGRWSQAELLLAGLSDRVSELAWAYSSVHAANGVKPKRPKPIPRPGVDTSGKRRVTSLEDRLASADPRTRKIAELMRARQPIPPELLQ